MLRKFLFLFAGLTVFLNAMACTTFFINKNGQMLFGRNYDWVTATGMINTNLRGMQKTSLQIDEGKNMTWISKYGSITFNQYGKEFPTGGMNEKGLVVELMWLSESKFPAPDQRPAFSVLQWIQYQLDNCSTIEEVIATDKKIRINAEGAPQHYLIADANGNAATIEFLDGQMVVHKGGSLPYPVLSNSTYQESVGAVERAAAKKDSLRFTDNSLQRFSTACKMINRLDQTTPNKPLVEYSFEILNAVSQGSFTRWSIVYDITNRKIHFKTADYGEIKIVDLKTFDLSCTAGSYAFNMNQAGRGDISKRFEAYSNTKNRAKLKEAFSNSKSQIDVTESSQNQIADNAAAVICKD